MTLSEKVLAAAEAHGVAKSELDKLDKQLADTLADMEKDGADEDVLLLQVEELTAKIDDLRPEVEATAKKLNALKAAETSLAARAKPALPNGAPAIIKSHPRLSPSHQAGDLFVRMALIKAVAYINGIPAEQVLMDRYGNDDAMKAVFDYSRRSAISPADTTTAGWAAELVNNDMQGFLDMIKHFSVGAALAVRSMMLQFDGYGNLTIPKINNLTNPGSEPAWVGEGGAIPVQRFTFGSTTISRYKLASIVPMTREIVQQSTPSIETIIRSAMQEAYAQNLDRALLATTAQGGAAVAGVKPASLRIGETTAAGATGGTGIENLIADITGMLSGLASNGLGQRPLLMINDQDFISASMLVNPLGVMMFQTELAGGRLLGVEVVHSLNVPVNTAVMVEAPAIATAFDAPEMRISDEATIVLASANLTPPTMAIDAAGALGTSQQVLPDGGISVNGGASGAGTAGFEAQSLFQTNQIAIRGLWPTSWGIMRTGAVQVRTAIDWK
jgi:HK97 family phage major capsid protein